MDYGWKEHIGHVLALGLFMACAGCQPGLENVPLGYEAAYVQTFDSPAALQDFEFTTADKWIFSPHGNGSGALEFTGPGDYQPPVRSPLTIGLIRGRRFGDFILEADLLQTGKEYGHRDMCLFFGFQDPSHFYYVHLASQADDNAHNIFVVNGEPRTNIAERTTEGIDWGSATWHRVRVERRVADGTIRVFFDDMTEPVMVARDRTFGAGLIGFGSFDDSGRIDNIRIAAPVVIGDARTFFERKEP